MNILAALSWGQYALVTFFVMICVLLICVILLQKGRGGGLAGAFGGTGGYSAFGAKTGDVFTWITIVLTSLFVITAAIGTQVLVPADAVDETLPAITSPDTAGDDGADAGSTGSSEDTSTQLPQ